MSTFLSTFLKCQTHISILVCESDVSCEAQDLCGNQLESSQYQELSFWCSPTLCFKSNTKLLISDLSFLQWHLTKIRYLTGKQVHLDHEPNGTVFYTDVKCFSHPKHLVQNTSFCNMPHLSCCVFVHDPCWLTVLIF